MSLRNVHMCGMVQDSGLAAGSQHTHALHGLASVRWGR
jgi:hypothetical protein